MAKVHLMGRDFDVAPYMIDALEEAAPFIDAINAAPGSVSTVVGGVKATTDLIGFLAVGLSRIDPELTAAHIKTKVGFADIATMQQAFTDILADSGMGAEPSGTWRSVSVCGRKLRRGPAVESERARRTDQARCGLRGDLSQLEAGRCH